MKKCYLLIAVISMLFFCSCDMFLVYRLTVTDEGGRGISKASVTDADDGFVLSTDSAGFIQLTKITGGIRPQRTKTVSLHKAGYHDTVVTLTGSTTIKLRAQ